MNSLSKIFIYSDREYLLLKKNQKIEILTLTILYLFRLCKASELMDGIRSHLPDWTGADGIAFRKRLMNSGDIQKCMKFYFYDRIINVRTPGDRTLFDLSEEDAQFVERMLKQDHKNVRFLKAALKQLCKSGYPPRSMSSFEQGLNWAVSELQVSAAKHINKNFRFLTQSGQMHKADLQGDMMHQAVYGIYRAYPEIQSKLHMKNIGLASLRNRGVNILKEQTTKSRQRLVKNKDGTFSGTLLSFAHAGFEASQQDVDYTTGGAISVCNHLMVGLDGKSAAYERPTDVDRKRDLARSVAQISDKLRGPAPKTFVSLLMGEYHGKFSKWLGRPNDEACDDMNPREYAEKCRVFLGIEPQDARKFVLQLRTHLRDFQN